VSLMDFGEIDRLKNADGVVVRREWHALQIGLAELAGLSFGMREEPAKLSYSTLVRQHSPGESMGTSQSNRESKTGGWMSSSIAKRYVNGARPKKTCCATLYLVLPDNDFRNGTVRCQHEELGRAAMDPRSLNPSPSHMRPSRAGAIRLACGSYQL